MALSDEDCQRIAEQIFTFVVKEKQDFWIDSEQHYNDHKSWQQFVKEIPTDDMYQLKELIKLFRLSKGIFVRAVIGFAVLGTLVVTAVGIFAKKLGF